MKRKVEYVLCPAEVRRSRSGFVNISYCSRCALHYRGYTPNLAQNEFICEMDSKGLNEIGQRNRTATQGRGEEVNGNR
jgi:hypothetical protein